MLAVLASACAPSGSAIEHSAKAAHLRSRAMDITRIGLRHEDGEGVPMDLSLAAFYYAKACDAGSAHGCGSLGVLRFYGHGVHADSEAGLALLREACDGAYGQACSNLGILYALGRSVPVEIERAARLFERGCERGSDLGCTSRCRLCVEHGLPRCETCPQP